MSTKVSLKNKELHFLIDNLDKIEFCCDDECSVKECEKCKKYILWKEIKDELLKKFESYLLEGIYNDNHSIKIILGLQDRKNKLRIEAMTKGVEIFKGG